MIDLSQLRPDSILGNLPLHDFQVDLSTPTSIVIERFEKHPDLPGVIVTDGAVLVGIVSRQRFLEHMSRRFSQDIFLKRPIEVLLSFIPFEPLQLPDTYKIAESAHKALNRIREAVYEPIVVSFRDGSLRLLNIHDLLLAQSRVLALVNQTVESQKLELQQLVEQLKEEQSKTEEANRTLEIQQISIRDHNQLLEQQKAELVKKSDEITQLNQRFSQVGQILSDEGKKAFQATFEGVDAISSNTDMMIEIGRALASELETMRLASAQIKEVSRRARFLSLQAAVLTNQLGSELSGINRITSDITKLSSEAFEAGQRMDETTSRLKYRMGELTNLAKNGATAAQSLLQKVARTEVALSELEKLVEIEQAQSKHAIHEPEFSVDAVKVLMQRVEQAGVALSELEKLSENGSVTHLINKIQQRLKYGPKPVLR
jgi:hypothetical protein